MAREDGVSNDSAVLARGPAASSTPDTRPERASVFTPPTISLPKGGGALRGIGEKFAANPVTGTGSLTVPIAGSPCRPAFGSQRFKRGAKHVFDLRTGGE